ncbi:hypothetical protein CTA2_12113 [Colletotrichum tanaceti]|uniref:Uncharacterized protein n=1 Tax=Colletotrichum tanaceti TaxID=1306861 RepID=A0A4U6XDI7_9PEZI|nr:hypothetical protein CTA2_12113 [Colletotrichum tanaceti]TKW53423.1 hypothetical protein CTA1_8831 [Colletotrichum tanaceti]
MLRSSVAIVFVALAAIPTAFSQITSVLIPGEVCFEGERSGCTNGRCISGECVRSCNSGAEQICPQRCENLRFREGWCSTSRPHVCRCTNHDTMSSRPGQGGGFDKRDDVEVYEDIGI